MLEKCDGMRKKAMSYEFFCIGLRMKWRCFELPIREYIVCMHIGYSKGTRSSHGRCNESTQQSGTYLSRSLQLSA